MTFTRLMGFVGLLASATLTTGCKSGPATQESAEGGYQAPVLARTGVQLYSFRKQLAQDFEGTLARIAAMGFTLVETHARFGLGAQDFVAALTRHGLKPVSMIASYEDLQSDLATIIDEARIYGVKYVVCPWLLTGGAPFTAADNQRAIEVFRALGTKLNAAGLHLVYHPHGYEFHDGGAGTGKPMIDLMIESTTTGFVDFEMDVYWVAITGNDPADYLRRYPGRWKMLHLKEIQEGTEMPRHDGRTDTERQVTLGTGLIDFPAIIREAEAQGTPWYFIEDESSRSVQQVPASLAYLKGMLN